MKIRVAMALAVIVAAAGQALAAPADGFAAFWRAFAAAAAKDDAKALAAMTDPTQDFGEDGGSFAKIHAGLLGPAARRCLARGKPDADPQAQPYYYVVCSQMMYIFTKQPTGWKFTGVGPDD